MQLQQALPRPSPRKERHMSTERAVTAATRAFERMRRARARTGLPSPVALVVTPRLTFTFGDQSMPFHAASASKVVTAAIIAGLVDAGRLTFDTPLGAVLPAADTDGLPSEPGVDATRDVTVDHLLSQTSGLPDFFEPPRGHSTRADFTSSMSSNVRWTPTMLLDEAKSLPAAGRPGTFRYADTNWVLLGRIAEEITGEPFAHLMQQRIFDACGMESAATPYDYTLMPEDVSSINVAPLFIKKVDVTRSKSLSLDWACGNVVARPEDYVRFLRALHNGALMSSASLARLTKPRNRFRTGIHYGAGTMTLHFNEFTPGFNRRSRGLSGHLGISSAHTFAYPEHDAYVVLNFHATSEMRRSFVAHMRLAGMIARSLGQVRHPLRDTPLGYNMRCSTVQRPRSGLRGSHQREPHHE